MGPTPRSRTLGTSASKVPNVGYRADPLSATGRQRTLVQATTNVRLTVPARVKKGGNGRVARDSAGMTLGEAL